MKLKQIIKQEYVIHYIWLIFIVLKGGGGLCATEARAKVKGGNITFILLL